MIYFASRTGNVRSIVERLSLPNTEIQAHTTAQEPFLLFTYTDGLGEIPKEIERFMERSHALCKGVIVSGNKNFGVLFGAAGDKLSRQYNIPIVRKVDLRGFDIDVQAIKDYYEVTFSEAINQVQ